MLMEDEQRRPSKTSAALTTNSGTSSHLSIFSRRSITSLLVLFSWGWIYDRSRRSILFPYSSFCAVTDLHLVVSYTPYSYTYTVIGVWQGRTRRHLRTNILDFSAKTRYEAKGYSKKTVFLWDQSAKCFTRCLRTNERYHKNINKNIVHVRCWHYEKKTVF